MQRNSSPMPDTELNAAENNKKYPCTLGLYFHCCHGWEKVQGSNNVILVIKQHRVISTLKQK